MAAVYYKISGNNVYFTNENKSDYTERGRSESVASGKNVIVELYNGSFILTEYADNMFRGMTNTSIPQAEYFDFSDVDTARNMFAECPNLSTVNSYTWRMPKIRYIEGFFADCPKLTTAFCKDWGCEKIIDAYGMFQNCSSLTRIDFTGWHPAALYNFNFMFENCSSLSTLTFDDDSWGMSDRHTSATTGMCAFKNCSSLTSFSFNFINDTSRFYSLEQMFSGCNNLKSLDISKLIDQDIIYLYRAFYRCYSLKELNLSGSKWTFNWTDSLKEAFYGCSSLTSLDLSGWKLTGAGLNFAGMFDGCSALTEIKVRYGSDWAQNAGGTYGSSSMFQGCRKLPNWDGTVTYARANDKEAFGYFTGVWIPEEVTAYIKNENDLWIEASESYIKTTSGWKLSRIWS